MEMPQNPRRYGIFFFYDAQGVVDDYVDTLVEGMKPNLQELCIVVNGKLNEAGRRKFEAWSDRLIIRENVGLDAWAYKTALEDAGWEKLQTFDEVVMFNATIMGPVYPFSEMFSEMDGRDLDFWGITWYHQYDADPFGTIPEGYIPRHIQSHFHAYRRSLISSRAFQDYWRNLPVMNNYFDSVGKHEVPFTKRFESLGFKSDVYVNTEDLEGVTTGPILFAPKKLIAEKRCPIFKRRSFFHPYDDVLNQSVGNATRDLYEYLRDHTDYDTNLIWNNALRTMNLADMVKALQLTYVLPTASVNPAPAHPALPEHPKIALIFHLYYLDLLEESLGYAASMPPGTDLIFTVGGEDRATAVREATKDLPYNVRIVPIENRGRDVSALLVGAKDLVADYDLVCFAHDKKVTQLSPGSIGQGFALKCFENLLPSPEFVQNVITKFSQEPRLGMAFPPAPNHADYFFTYCESWGPNFKNTKAFLEEELGIQVPLARVKEPIAPLGTMFWFRPAALKPLFDRGWEWEDFPPEPNGIDGTMLHAVERAYGYVAQSAGYFSAFLFSDSFARIELTSLSYYTKEFAYAVATQVGAGTSMKMLKLVRGRATFGLRMKRVVKKILPRRALKPATKLYHRIFG